MGAPSPDEWLAGGRVGRPHGLDGSFYVVDARAALLSPGVRVRVAGREAEVVRRAGTDERPIVRLAGFDGRDAAEELRGLELLVPRSAAPPLEDDEWWAEDLEGCRVVDGDRELGRVARLVPLPSCEALEVSGGGEAFLVPLVRDAVRSVDVEAKVIDVDLAFLGETAPAFARDAADPDAADAPSAGPDALSGVSAGPDAPAGVFAGPDAPSASSAGPEAPSGVSASPDAPAGVSTGPDATSRAFAGPDAPSGPSPAEVR